MDFLAQITNPKGAPRVTPQNPDSQYPFEDFFLGLPGEDLAGPPDEIETEYPSDDWEELSGGLDFPFVHFDDPRDLWRCDAPELWARITRQVWPLVVRGLEPAESDGAYYLVDVGRRLQPVAGHLAFTSIPLKDQEEFLYITCQLDDVDIDCQIDGCPIPWVRRGTREKPNAGWTRHKFVHELTSWLSRVLADHADDDLALGMPRLVSGQHPWTLTGVNTEGVGQ
jgi:hypothetical protein